MQTTERSVPDTLNMNRFRGVAALALLGVIPLAAMAAAPIPANDTPAGAQVIGPAVPAVIYGTLEGAADDVNVSGLASVPDAYIDGPDVFYSFTPATTDTYRIQLLPWQKAPLRSSERRMSIYVATDLGVTPFMDGNRAPSSARPVHVDVLLTGGVTYYIGVDNNLETRDNVCFTLIVDTLSPVIPDDCVSIETIPSTSLPYAVLNNIDASSNNFEFIDQGTGRCAVAASTTATGIDHVFLFTPTANGDYAFELVSEGFDGVIYIDDSCPFPGDGCMGASHNGMSGSGKHDLVVATLEANKDYWIVVDEDDGTNTTGTYTLIVDTAYGYEMNETEPNDTPATATPLTTPLNGGQILGPLDIDYYAVTGLTGDRMYAYVNNGGSSNTTLDMDVWFYATDGATLIEFDDEDGDGHTAGDDYDDLEYIYSTSSPVIAGARMTADGTHYLAVDYQGTSPSVVHRYRLHVGVEPASRPPAPECEPNDAIVSADRSGKDYYGGVIATDGDLDVYAFEAAAGDRVFVALDGDPERDATGFDAPSTDAKAFAGLVKVYDPAGDLLFDDISDSNSIQSGPDYPAQGAFFVARVTGTHYVSVQQQSSTQYGPTKTYELAIFLNDAAPSLTDELDPQATLTPDYLNDVIAVTATDNQAGDSGICAASLFNDTNLQITNLSFAPGDPTVTFDIETVNPAINGEGKLLITDCQGNTFCQFVKIDVSAPVCDGFNFSNRSPYSLHDPIHVTDNDLVGINGTIDIADAGLITDVNVTMTIDALDTGDLDIYLVSPTGTVVELVTDRMSSSGIDMKDTTFDDDGLTILSLLSGDAPYTGIWLPEDPAGLAKLNGEQAQGTWKLNVVDDASSESFGATLVRWSLDVDATFVGPEVFGGTASDDDGILSVVLTSGTNVQLNLPPGFTPGDLVVPYTVTLLDPTQNGSATVTVTDIQQNTCQSVISLNGFADTVGPANAGSVTKDLTFKNEVQEVVGVNDPVGVVSTIPVSDSFLVGEVEVAVMVDADDQGRIGARVTHGADVSVIVDHIGLDERSGAGNSKPSFDIILDDDAPQADDIHLEPALGTVATLGVKQTDGRNVEFGNSITADDRDAMLFRLAGGDASGNWALQVIDRRDYSGTADAIARRWALTLKNPCGPERYVGRAIDLLPGAGVSTIQLAAGATNLVVVASFTPGDEIVEYRVELIDPSQPGSGTVEIIDGSSNVTTQAISLAAASGDENLPLVNGSVNPLTFEFEGTASDSQAGDSGLASIELGPWWDNLQITSVDPLPAASADFTVGLVNPALNGRGYVKVTDGCGLRAYVLVEIDANGPVCTGAIDTTKRYFCTDLPAAIPDNNTAGVTSNITVTDTDVIADVDITFNITHPSVQDIDMSLIAPVLIGLFTDRGSTGNDYLDVTLDDEAAEVLPSTSTLAPFTGSWQPEDGVLSTLDGYTAAGTYTLKVADDYSYYVGTFDSWSLLLAADTFPPRYDGRAAEPLAHDTGIALVELLAGASNLTLVVDPNAAAGDSIVRYSVSLTNPLTAGDGTVRVTDGVGNTCEVPLCLEPIADKGDTDGDGDVDLDDYPGFEACFTGPVDTYGCGCSVADFNNDNHVDLYDYAELQLLF
ncbi:MAG: proprotein convertase P-domain-containing protein [Phycisphaerae bacterium]|nr:proprotein convertase P-domain-containing protein [Phycisphaerae bacterium]